MTHPPDELAWRGPLLQTTGDGNLRATIDSRHIALSCGLDPTAPSLHIGNLVQILAHGRFQVGRY